MTKSDKIDQQEAAKALADTIYVIGGKWKLPILHSICGGNIRFKDIEESIPGLSHRMLSKNLKELEQNKLITRIMSDETLFFEYHFTEYSKEYGDLMLKMIEWGKSHRKKIIQSE